MRLYKGLRVHEIALAEFGVLVCFLSQTKLMRKRFVGGKFQVKSSVSNLQYEDLSCQRKVFLSDQYFVIRWSFHYF